MSHKQEGRRVLLFIWTLFCLAFFAAFLSSGNSALVSPTGDQSGAPAPELSSLLDRAGEYCDRLSRSVLNFICRERIDEWFRVEVKQSLEFRGDNITYLTREEESHAYTYDYQLVRDRDGTIRESRILLREDKKDVRVENAPLKTHSFSYAYVVMGPLGLLSRANQKDHDFKILREERIGGEPAVVIEAHPKPGVKVDHLFGTIWLRRKDAGILKIQWNPASIGNYAGIEEIGRRLKMTPIFTLTSEYAFEKNGIRFPSRYTVKEVYVKGKGRHYQRSKTEVAYDRYQFFTVETKVRY